MARASEHKTFSRPDETREFPTGRRRSSTSEAAWWAPRFHRAGVVERRVGKTGIAKTKSCEAPHFQYHLSGRLAIRMDDGTEFIAGPGDVTALPSGHDAWVVGDEAAVVVDWFGRAATENA